MERVGEVRNVFGKKRAKEECARGVVGWLEGVKRERVERRRGVMGGVEKGNGKEEGLSGGKTDAEHDGKPGEEAMWKVDVDEYEDINADEHDNEGFEDAVEQLAA